MSDEKKSSHDGEYWRSPFRKPVSSTPQSIEVLDSDFLLSVEGRLHALETAVAVLIRENTAMKRALQEKHIYPKHVIESIDRRTI